MNEFTKKPKFLTYRADKMENYLYKYVSSYKGETSKYIKNYFVWDELVHNFSLIHDDIEDNDKVRRHKPTLWTIWGISKAIITGNSILVLGNKVLNNMTNNGSSEKDLFLSQKILTESYLKMMEGQFLDISFEKEKNISLEKYLKMISLKTGALIECSVTLGAIASKKDIDNFLYNLDLILHVSCKLD